MRRIIAVLFAFLTFSLGETENSCMTCHTGVADICDKNSGMMQAILQKAEEAGVNDNDCVGCHGGNPQEKEKISIILN